jgi:hypothetical protein
MGGQLGHLSKLKVPAKVRCFSRWFTAAWMRKD